MIERLAIYICVMPQNGEEKYFEVNDKLPLKLSAIEKVVQPIVDNYNLEVYQAGSRLVLLGGDFFSRRLNDAYADILNILHIAMPKDFQVKCFITVHIGGGLLPLDMTDEGEKYSSRRDYSSVFDIHALYPIVLDDENVEEMFEKIMKISKEVSIIKS
jgi:hypothetical protein